MSQASDEGSHNAEPDGSEPERKPRRKRGARKSPARDASGSDSGDTNRADDGRADTHAPESDPKEGARGEEGRDRTSKRRRWQERRRKKRKGRAPSDGSSAQGAEGRPNQGQRKQGGGGQATQEVTGILVLEHANHGHLRVAERDFMPSKSDVHVAPRLVQKFGLSDGAMIQGTYRRGQGRNKWDLAEVQTVDGMTPKEARKVRSFKSLTSIDPDFHYAVGDSSGEVSLKVIDLLCPVGRGQRGLIVAPPRSGKTILLQQFAKAVEKTYPEVKLMVLLVDERPEEATEWRRTMEKGEVFVSTNDEMPKKHVELAEVVWRRCKRLVELGQDVVLLLDSITRLGRAYNNVKGNSGKTMSGGIDSRALERPKQFFGSARNTETAGSLTILGTTLIETGSQMDKVIFEEFKGTGNMELVLSRRLADRRIFPAIDIERTGTRKEEKLHSSRRLKRINTLRRVVQRMHWAEAMELLITKLDDVDQIDDFLERFEVDPEA